MKNVFKALLLVGAAMLGMASCENVPSPFDLPDVRPTEDSATVITAVQADSIIKTMAAGETSSKSYTVIGYITDVFSTISNNQQSFWMADTKDGGKVLEAYWANLPEGVSTFKTGMKVKITGKLTKYVKTGASEDEYTAEMKNPEVEIQEGGDTPEEEGIAATCAQAKTIAEALEDNASTEETYTVTGYITDVFSTISSNQQSFWMDDTKDGGKVLEAYWANLPTGVSAFTVGMKVKITGKIMKYVKSGSTDYTAEIKNATVTILESGGGDTPTGESLTCAQAAAKAQALDDNASTTESYSVTGYITDVFATVSNNQQSFWMADTKDGGKVFEAYWANLPSGTSAFTAGMKVKITGKIMKYVKSGSTDYTAEIKNATVEILEEGGGDTPTPTPTGEGVSIDGTTVTLSNSASAGTESTTIDLNAQGWSNATAVTTVTMSDGTVITFDANGNTNAPKYYTATKGVRVYANSTISFAASKNIAKIVMTCDSYNGTNYVGNETATVSFSGNNAVYTNTFTGTSGGGTQLRVQTITVYYAK